MEEKQKSLLKFILDKLKETVFLLKKDAALENDSGKLLELFEKIDNTDLETAKAELNSLFKVFIQMGMERRQLLKDFKIAEEIQNSLIPDKPPVIDGFEIESYFKPARVISGDYLDFIPISTNLYGITIADVSGKGLPGSMIMSMARSVLRFESRQNPFPGLVLREVSKVIMQDLKPGLFITMIYAILNTSSKGISIANAGHSPLLHYRALTGELTEINPKGVGIGIGDTPFFEKYLYEQKTILQTKDILFFYTDGLTEAMNEQDEEFGIEPVEKIIKENADLSANQILELIKKAVEEFTKGAVPHDDITLILIKTK